MPSLALAALLPLALVTTTTVAAPLHPSLPKAIRLVGRAPTAFDPSLDHLHERHADSFARLANVAKRGIKVSSSANKRAFPTKVPLELHYNEYDQLDAHAGEVSIGGQLLPVLFDTGSPDLVVPVDCESGCANGFFNTTASSTFVNDGGEVSVAYGTGAATGYVADDTVRAGDLEVKKQVFVAATELNTAGGENWAAIFGLAPGGGAYVRCLVPPRPSSSWTLIDLTYSSTCADRRAFVLPAPRPTRPPSRPDVLDLAQGRKARDRLRRHRQVAAHRWTCRRAELWSSDWLRKLSPFPHFRAAD